MYLNCVGSRARLQAETDLEEASKLVEKAVNTIQVKQSKTDLMTKAIQDAKAKQRAERQHQLERLMARKARLEEELAAIDHKLAEKQLLLQERTLVSTATAT